MLLALTVGANVDVERIADFDGSFGILGMFLLGQDRRLKISCGL